MDWWGLGIVQDWWRFHGKIVVFRLGDAMSSWRWEHKQHKQVASCFTFMCSLSSLLYVIIVKGTILASYIRWSSWVIWQWMRPVGGWWRCMYSKLSCERNKRNLHIGCWVLAVLADILICGWFACGLSLKLLTCWTDVQPVCVIRHFTNKPCRSTL